MFDTPEPAKPADVVPDHALFGRHVTTRHSMGMCMTFAVVFGIGAAVSVYALGQLLLNVIRGHSSQGQPIDGKDYVTFFLMAFISLAVTGGLAALLYLRAMTRTHFHERGAVVARSGVERRAMAYADVVKFGFNVTRNYYNGIYTGTTLNVRMVDGQKKKLTYSGRYKEKPKGFGFTILSKKFQGDDEMDVVRMIVAEAVADRLVEQIARDGSVEWAAKVKLSATGVTAPNGKRKNQEVPYERIVNMTPKSGFLYLFCEGDEKSFVGVPFSADNAWPGFVVWQRMMEAAIAGAGASTEQTAAINQPSQ